MSSDLKQSVDIVGFLRSQLSGLQGIPTLCFELIQNADDVKDEEGKPAAARITFDVCDDALWVENDGVFRERDFERMKRISWGDKRNEAGTTGTFGIGFIAVYQITDAPEIFSSGRHWTLHPEDEGRIIDESLETKFTRFRLPWAFEESILRKELGIPPVKPHEIDDFVEQMRQAIAAASLFLKQVTTLELKRSGRVVQRIQIERDGNQLLIQANDVLTTWLILERTFDDHVIRRRYAEMIEAKRSAAVKLAIPDTPLADGLLYAFLPSETRTGLPFHINADFYPSQDRKRILLDNSYKGEWNRLAIRCAAQTLADHVEALLSQFEPVTFWEFVERVRRAAELPNKEYAGFWETLKPGIRNKATCLTLSNQRCRPAEAFYLDTDEQAAGAIFQGLGLPIVHSDLRPYQKLLLESGCRRLKASDVHQAFDRLQLCQRTEQAGLPTFLQPREQWQALWRALDNLLRRTPQNEQSYARTLLGKCAIAFGTDGAAWPPEQLLRAEPETQALFSSIQPHVWYAPGKQPHEFVNSLVPVLTLQKGIDLLEQSSLALSEAWKADRFAFSHLYGWLANQRNELRRDAVLCDRLRTCPIWPAADGALRSLTNLYLPGDFEDPLGLAQLVDVNALGGHELLENTLGVKRLDFLTYVRDLMPPVVRDREFSISRRLKLLKVLAENLGKLQGQAELQEKLSALPLVWCGEKRFSISNNVYFDTEDIRQLFGDKYNLAQAPEDAPYEAIKALYEWLGVQASPRVEHLVQEIEGWTAHAPTVDSSGKIEAIFKYLATNWIAWKKAGIPPQFEKLKKTTWLRASKDATRWFLPKDVNSVFRSYLFESQGNFLQIDRRLQERGSDFLAYLGVNSEPTPIQMLHHLLWCSDRNQPVSQEVYRTLNERLDEIEPAVLRTLVDSRCLYLKYPDGEANYVKPSLVFWEDHPFGSYRFKLGSEFSAFKPLLDRLSVKTKPDAADAIDVLLEIADHYGSTNIPIEQSTEVWSTIMECWRLLSRAFEQGEITEEEIARLLGDQKTIPADRANNDGTTVTLLERPKWLFFDDRPRWGVKFRMLENNLVRQIDGAWQAMAAAGVRRLSKVVETGLHSCVNPQTDSFIPSLIAEREPLVRRVIEAYREKVSGGFELDDLKQLNFIQGESIEIVRTFNGFGRPESVPDSVQAICVDRTLYFCKPDGWLPWLEIASELSYVLYPSAELSSLALELKEIFSAATTDEAGKSLDILGYPQLPEAFLPSQSKTPTVSLAGEASPSEQDNDDQNVFDDDESGQNDWSLDKDNTVGNTTQPNPNTNLAKRHESKERSYETTAQLFNNGHSQGGSVQPDLVVHPPEQRPTSRLYSYVYTDGAHQDDSSSEKDTTDHRSEVEKKGIDCVLAYERLQGRTPTDMNTLQSNHPGYDIKSIDAFGHVRYIEVKALSGQWNGPNPARMTHTEFEHGIKHGEDYWLYIVEHVNTPREKLYMIQNPSKRVDFFLFDHGWMVVAEDATQPSI